VWQGIHFSLAAGVAFLSLVPLAGPLVALVGHAPELQVLESAPRGRWTPPAIPSPPRPPGIRGSWPAPTTTWATRSPTWACSTTPYGTTKRPARASPRRAAAVLAAGLPDTDEANLALLAGVYARSTKIKKRFREPILRIRLS
jgi:hypothetical protein